MKVLENKKREATLLIEETENEKLVEQILSLLRTEKNNSTPIEKFKKIAERYDNTLRRLA
jgi:hypothetical protein